jgi:hypothetical protein
MVDFLTQYFFTNRAIALPGLGQLTVEEVSPHYDVTQQWMLPPGHKFTWQPGDHTDLSVQPLLGFISRKTGVPEEDCYGLIASTIDQIKNSLETSGEWTWNGVGKLVYLSVDKTGFVPHAVLSSYSPRILVKRVIRDEKKHDILAGEKEKDSLQAQMDFYPEREEVRTKRWWIPALILCVATLGLIMARASGWW